MNISSICSHIHKELGLVLSAAHLLTRYFTVNQLYCIFLINLLKVQCWIITSLDHTGHAETKLAGHKCTAQTFQVWEAKKKKTIKYHITSLYNFACRPCLCVTVFQRVLQNLSTLTFLCHLSLFSPWQNIRCHVTSLQWLMMVVICLKSQECVSNL